MRKREKLKEKNGEMLFTGLHDPVKEVFKISGFNSIFRIFSTDEEALAAMNENSTAKNNTRKA
ncbi:MAG: STAS domain-containing protein [Nitrospiraceae bacterium]|nr:STAS domain-containing protein [Nitrospiraceae bacterium]